MKQSDVTNRKVQTESSTGSVGSSRVRTTLTLCVETIDFDSQACRLRVKGTNIQENQYVKVRVHLEFFLEFFLIFNYYFFFSYVTLDNKIIYKGGFFLIEIYTLHESFPLMYGMLGLDHIWPRYINLKIWNLRVHINLNIEKIAFKVVQMKFLAMHITSKKNVCIHLQ